MYTYSITFINTEINETILLSHEYKLLPQTIENYIIRSIQILKGKELDYNDVYLILDVMC